MLIVFCIIGVVLSAIGFFINIKFREKLYNCDREWIYVMFIFTGTIILIVSIVSTIIIGARYSRSIAIDEKIEVYKNENTNIEHQISMVVEKYTSYESETFEKFKNENPTTLVSLFPELKSNELVAKQIEIYVGNNEMIKNLECEKLQYKIYAWWLFFGD